MNIMAALVPWAITETLYNEGLEIVSLFTGK